MQVHATTTDRPAGACCLTILAALVLCLGWSFQVKADEAAGPAGKETAAPTETAVSKETAAAPTAATETAATEKVTTASATTQPAETGKPAVTLTSATAPSASTPTSGQIVLAYKFQPGQFVHYSSTCRVKYTTQLGDQYKTTTGQALSLEDRTFHSHQSNETVSHLRVVTVDEQGLALVEPVIDSTRMSAKLHDKNEVVFDSATDLTETPPEFRAVRESIGRTVARFQMDPCGKLVKAIIVDLLAPQPLREAAEKLDLRFNYLPPLPATPVSIGGKWREDFSTLVVNEGLKQPLPIRRIYELTGVADGIAVIKFKTLILTPVNDPEVEKQVLQLTPTGTIEFDLERGLVRSYKATINRTAMNAFGPQSLMRVTGEATETLVTTDPAAKTNTAP